MDENKEDLQDENNDDSQELESLLNILDEEVEEDSDGSIVAHDEDPEIDESVEVEEPAKKCEIVDSDEEIEEEDTDHDGDDKQGDLPSHADIKINLAIDILNKFQNTHTTIVKNFANDRQEIQEVIDMIKERVEGEVDAPRVWLESLVSAIEIKSSTNANTIKAIDSLTKLIAASKNSTFMDMDSGNSDDDDLMKLLEETDKYPEEKGGNKDV